MTSSLEKPNTKASLLSIKVTSMLAPNVSDSRLVSSRPPKPAPRTRTRGLLEVFMLPSGCLLGMTRVVPGVPLGPVPERGGVLGEDHAEEAVDHFQRVGVAHAGQRREVALQIHLGPASHRRVAVGEPRAVEGAAGQPGFDAARRIERMLDLHGEGGSV